jgi:hypothetical protein
MYITTASVYFLGKVCVIGGECQVLLMQDVGVDP